MGSAPRTPLAPGRAYVLLVTLGAAYIGVYLCRKNLSVAVPLLQRTWGATKEEVGVLGTASTIAYACGKVFFGPVTDRLGGRRSLLFSMGMVVLLGAAGAFAPSLVFLTLSYSASRLFGAASWGAMLKQVSEWFGPPRLAFACGLLTLSIVFGGALAVSFAGLVARVSGDSWPAVLGVPSLVLAVLVVICWLVLPRGTTAKEPSQARPDSKTFSLERTLDLFKDRKFLVVAMLSFTLTLVRETFNFWAVDFIRTEGGRQVSSAVAAVFSTPFDICGAVGIVVVGWVFDRLQPGGRQRLLVAILSSLTLLLIALPMLFHFGLWALATGVGLIGFLVYGPYSLLAGVLSVEVRGKDYAATVSGLVDGTGYIAGSLSGMFFGRILMVGGYSLGFKVMGGLTLLAAVLCCFLYRKTKPAAARSVSSD
jgi:MFS transporter, OPA family, glycerol-3-phosphate transporter